jgi:hypothetical protein
VAQLSHNFIRTVLLHQSLSSSFLECGSKFGVTEGCKEDAK